MNKLFYLTPTNGHGRGKKIGVPTINFKVDTIDIPHGIYAGYLIDDDKKYKSAIHFGPRPVYNESDPSFEVFIIQKELPVIRIKKYGIEIVGFIREILNFPSEQLMVKQIKKDVKLCMKLLES